MGSNGQSRNLWNGWIMLSLHLIVISCIFFDAAVAQDRRWSVRKTGEFGRKIVENVASASSAIPSRARISKELQLPSERRTDNSQFFRGAGANPSELEIRKPSIDLELPRFAHQRNFVADQEAQETEDQQGYAYPKPDEEESKDEFDGYVYNTPAPAVRPNDEPEEDPATPAPELPAPGVPIVINTAFNAENQEDIDSQSNTPSPNRLAPQVVGVPTDDNKPACSESHDGSDPACWPHGYEGVIPGKAGEDYPVLSEIIQTGFSCDEQPFSGYYADTDAEARCQIFHICLKRNRYRKTHQWSFLCPNGTIFSQPDFVCVWWGDAPQCSDTIVRSLYNLNEQLGWDNVTEGGGTKQGGGARANDGDQLQGSMSAFNAKLTAANRQNSAIPYRVPVKVPDATSGRSRTKLQEVTQNGVHGSRGSDLDYGEHHGEESSNFETSLRKQSESRSKTKSASALHKSISEGYELKGSADGVQPFIVNREPPLAPTVQPQNENDVVMMPTLQRFPDGSDGYADIPVMLPHHTTNPPPNANYQQDSDKEEGYQYPNPTSTPAPTYLPPRRSTTPPPTTTEYFPPPTIPTEPPISPQENDNYEQYSPDRVTTTEQPEEGYRYPQPTTTDFPPEQEQGYNYPSPRPSQRQRQQQQQQAASQDNNDGYQYTPPTTTEPQYPTDQQEVDEDGYRYPNPTTTQRSSRFRQTNPTTSTEVVTEATTTELPAEEEDGYNYPVPTAGSQFESLRETTLNAAGYNYPRPTTTTENYPELSTQQSADIVREETTTTVPTTTAEVELPAGGYLPPRSNNQLSQQQQQGEDNSATEEVDYEEEDVANEVVTGPSSPAATSADEDESGYTYHHPTPPVSSSGREIVLNGGALDSDDKLNEILKQVQSGNIEAVDSSGKPIEFSMLKDLLLNSPRGSVDLKGELDSVTSSSTEVTTTPYANVQRETLPPQQIQPSGPAQQPQRPQYHTVTTATILPNNQQNNNLFNTNNNNVRVTTSNGGLSSPSGFYLPPNNGFNAQSAPTQQNQQQQQYYNGNQKEVVQYVDHPSFEINLPSREFETHTQSVDLNTIAVDANNNQQQNRPIFSQQQPQSGYYQSQPQQQFFQQQHQQQPPPGNYLPPPQQLVQVQAQQQQPRPSYNSVNNQILPTPQRQQQNQPQSQPNGEYLPPRQATSSILQPQYYTQSQTAPSRPLVSQPIQLTENIQLQQSFALPTQEPLLPTNNRNNLLDPKDIKIVPALFVHQHTSVAAHAHDNHVRGDPGRNIEEAFQTLDTAQSSYYPSSTSLSQQLSQLANLGSQTDSRSTRQRQFFRRSNAKATGQPSGGASHTIEKAHQVSTFTLEDARTPDEIQKYHHEDLKRFYKQNIAQHPGVLADALDAYPPAPPTTRRSLPVISSIAKESSTRSSSSRELPSSHRNEEYFIPVTSSYGGGSGPSSSSSSSGSRLGSNGGGSRNSNSKTNSNSNIYSQFRVNGGSSRSRSSESRGGDGGDRSSSSYHFADAEERTLLSSFLPEEEGGFGSRLLS